MFICGTIHKGTHEFFIKGREDLKMDVLAMVSLDVDLYILTFPCYNNSTPFMPIKVAGEACTIPDIFFDKENLDRFSLPSFQEDQIGLCTG